MPLDTIKASFCDGFFENEIMWVFDNRLQAICRVNIHNFEMDIISCYKGKEKFIARKIFSFRDKFYLVTRHSVKILIYDRKMPENDSAFYLQEPSAGNMSERYNVFGHYGYIYFFPLYMNEKLICFNTSTERYYSQNMIEPRILEKIGKDKLFVKSISLYDDLCFLALYGTRFYIRYNMTDKKSDLFQVEDADTRISHICFDGKQIWLREAEKNDVVYAGKQMIKIPKIHLNSNFCSIDGYIVILPLFSDKLILIKKNTFEVSVFNFPVSGCYNVVNCYEYAGYIFMFPYETQDLFIFGQKTKDIKRVDLKSAHYIESCFENCKDMLYEDEDINLLSLFRFGGRDNKSTYTQGANGNDVKNHIWKNIKNILN